MDSQFGVDVATNRADDLDRKCIAVIREYDKPTVLDLGCGAGGQSKRMAEVGAQVTAVDIHDYSSELHGFENISFQQSDVRNIPDSIDGNIFDFIVLQRMIHYISYKDALSLLTELKSALRGQLFVSVTGIDSDIGDRYAAKDVSIEKRFATLNKVGQETFSISEPMCLYSPEEFIELLRAAGFTVEECWISAFQNIKAVCE